MVPEGLGHKHSFFCCTVANRDLLDRRCKIETKQPCSLQHDAARACAWCGNEDIDRQGLVAHALGTDWLHRIVCDRRARPLLPNWCDMMPHACVGTSTRGAHADQEQKSWLAQTKFAEIYYAISQKFVFLTAAFVNGGMVGTCVGWFCGWLLKQHVCNLAGIIFNAFKLYGHTLKKTEAKVRLVHTCNRH